MDIRYLSLLLITGLSFLLSQIRITFTEDTANKSATDNKKGSCSVQLDVAFAVDASNSIWTEDFKKEVDFVKRFYKYFSRSNHSVHYSLISFAVKPIVYVNFSSTKNGEEFVSKLHSIRQPGGNKGSATHIGDAMETMRKVVFRTGNGARDNAFRLIVVTTDARTNTPWKLRKESKRLRQSGIYILGIGVGRLNLYELYEMVSSPKKNFIYSAVGLWNMNVIEELLQQAVCGRTAGSIQNNIKDKIPADSNKQASSPLTTREWRPRDFNRVGDANKSPILEKITPKEDSVLKATASKMEIATDVPTSGDGSKTTMIPIKTTPDLQPKIIKTIKPTQSTTFRETGDNSVTKTSVPDRWHPTAQGGMDSSTGLKSTHSPVAKQSTSPLHIVTEEMIVPVKEPKQKVPVTPFRLSDLGGSLYSSQRTPTGSQEETTDRFGMDQSSTSSYSRPTSGDLRTTDSTKRGVRFLTKGKTTAGLTLQYLSTTLPTEDKEVRSGSRSIVILYPNGTIVQVSKPTMSSVFLTTTGMQQKRTTMSPKEITSKTLLPQKGHVTRFEDAPTSSEMFPRGLGLTKTSRPWSKVPGGLTSLSPAQETMTQSRPTLQVSSRIFQDRIKASTESLSGDLLKSTDLPADKLNFSPESIRDMYASTSSPHAGKQTSDSSQGKSKTPTWSPESEVLTSTDYADGRVLISTAFPFNGVETSSMSEKDFTKFRQTGARVSTESLSDKLQPLTDVSQVGPKISTLSLQDEILPSTDSTQVGMPTYAKFSLKSEMPSTESTIGAAQVITESSSRYGQDSIRSQERGVQTSEGSSLDSSQASTLMSKDIGHTEPTNGDVLASSVFSELVPKVVHTSTYLSRADLQTSPESLRTGLKLSTEPGGFFVHTELPSERLLKSTESLAEKLKLSPESTHSMYALTSSSHADVHTPGSSQSRFKASPGSLESKVLTSTDGGVLISSAYPFNGESEKDFTESGQTNLWATTKSSSVRIQPFTDLLQVVTKISSPSLQDGILPSTESTQAGVPTYAKFSRESGMSSTESTNGAAQVITESLSRNGKDSKLPETDVKTSKKSLPDGSQASTLMSKDFIHTDPTNGKVVASSLSIHDSFQTSSEFFPKVVHTSTYLPYADLQTSLKPSPTSSKLSAKPGGVSVHTELPSGSLLETTVPPADKLKFSPESIHGTYASISSKHADVQTLDSQQDRSKVSPGPLKSEGLTSTDYSGGVLISTAYPFSVVETSSKSEKDLTKQSGELASTKSSPTSSMPRSTDLSQRGVLASTLSTEKDLQIYTESGQEGFLMSNVPTQASLDGTQPATKVLQTKFKASTESRKGGVEAPTGLTQGTVQTSTDLKESGAKAFPGTSRGTPLTSGKTMSKSDLVFATKSVLDDVIVSTQLGQDGIPATTKSVLDGTIVSTQPGQDGIPSSTKSVLDGAIVSTQPGQDGFPTTTKSVLDSATVSTQPGQDGIPTSTKSVLDGAIVSSQPGQDGFPTPHKSVLDGAIVSTQPGQDGFPTTTKSVLDDAIVSTQPRQDGFPHSTKSVLDDAIVSIQPGQDGVQVSTKSVLDGVIFSIQSGQDGIQASTKSVLDGVIVSAQPGQDGVPASTDSLSDGMKTSNEELQGRLQTLKSSQVSVRDSTGPSQWGVTSTHSLQDGQGDFLMTKLIASRKPSQRALVSTKPSSHETADYSMTSGEGEEPDRISSHTTKHPSHFSEYEVSSTFTLHDKESFSSTSLYDSGKEKQSLTGQAVDTTKTYPTYSHVSRPTVLPTMSTRDIFQDLQPTRQVKTGSVPEKRYRPTTRSTVATPPSAPTKDTQSRKTFPSTRVHTKMEREKSSITIEREKNGTGKLGTSVTAKPYEKNDIESSRTGTHFDTSTQDQSFMTSFILHTTAHVTDKEKEKDTKRESIVYPSKLTKARDSSKQIATRQPSKAEFDTKSTAKNISFPLPGTTSLKPEEITLQDEHLPNVLLSVSSKVNQKKTESQIPRPPVAFIDATIRLRKPLPTDKKVPVCSVTEPVKMAIVLDRKGDNSSNCQDLWRFVRQLLRRISLKKKGRLNVHVIHNCDRLPRSARHIFRSTGGAIKGIDSMYLATKPVYLVNRMIRKFEKFYINKISIRKNKQNTNVVEFDYVDEFPGKFAIYVTDNFNDILVDNIATALQVSDTQGIHAFGVSVIDPGGKPPGKPTCVKRIRGQVNVCSGKMHIIEADIAKEICKLTKSST